LGEDGNIHVAAAGGEIINFPTFIRMLELGIIELTEEGKQYVDLVKNTYELLMVYAYKRGYGAIAKKNDQTVLLMLDGSIEELVLDEDQIEEYAKEKGFITLGIPRLLSADEVDSLLQT